MRHVSSHLLENAVWPNQPSYENQGKDHGQGPVKLAAAIQCLDIWNSKYFRHQEFEVLKALTFQWLPLAEQGQHLPIKQRKDCEHRPSFPSLVISKPVPFLSLVILILTTDFLRCLPNWSCICTNSVSTGRTSFEPTLYPRLLLFQVLLDPAQCELQR